MSRKEVEELMKQMLFEEEKKWNFAQKLIKVSIFKVDELKILEKIVEI